MEFLHMPKELDGLSDKVLSYWFPTDNGEELPRRCTQEDRAVKEAWEGQGWAEWKRDLARGFWDLGPVYTTAEKSTGHEKKVVSQLW
jgi:hypothetical protein